MTTKNNVGWVRPEAVTHQATGQNEWPNLPIEQVADVNPRIDKSAIPDDLPVSFVPMPAVGAGDGSIYVEETRPAGDVKKGFTAFLEGDVLFAKITPCMENGKMAVVPKLVNGFGFGSTEFHVLRPKPGMDAKYLYYYVSSQSFRGEAERYMTGAVGQKRVSTTYLKQAKIPVASPAQQKRIVAEIEKQFSRLDEAVANLKRVKANLKRYKAAVLKAAVEGRLVETEAEIARREGRSYETGAQLLQRILETRRSQWKGKGKYKEPAAPDTTDLPELPEGWVWATVEQLGSVQLGKMLDKQKHVTGTPHRYLRNINVRWGSFDLDDLLEMNFEPDELTRFEIRDGDVLVCEGGEPARAAVWRLGACDLKYQKALHRVRFDGGYAPELLGVALEHMAKSGQLDHLYGGSTIKHFTREVFVSLQLPLPPLAEQHRIIAEVDRRLSIVREVESEVEVNLKRGVRLRQSVLQNAYAGQMLSGK